MIRLAEIFLLFAPVAIFIAWRVWAPNKQPSVGMIATMAVTLAFLAGALVWLRFQDAAPKDAVYVPSHIENGRIVPDRLAP